MRERLPFILVGDARVKNSAARHFKLKSLDLVRSRFFSFSLSAGLFSVCRFIRRAGLDAEKILLARREEEEKWKKEEEARRRKMMLMAATTASPDGAGGGGNSTAGETKTDLAQSDEEAKKKKEVKEDLMHG